LPDGLPIWVIRHLETLEAEARLVSAESVETDGELTSLEGRLSDIEARESSLEREMTTVRERLEVDQAAEGSLLSGATAGRVELATVLARVESLGRDIEQLASLAREFETRRDESAARRAQLR